MLPPFSYTWEWLLAFFYAWASTLYPAFSYTWGLIRPLLLLSPGWCRRAGDPVSPVFHFRHYKSLDMDAPEHSQREFPILAIKTFSTSCGGNRLPIKVCASDSSALLLGTWTSHPFRHQDLMWGRVLAIKFYASDSSALLLGTWSTLQSPSLLPSLSHAGESLTTY